ncbi:MAG TPA: porin [Beijerinckiaceae bacterium]|jgi:hypothetical protein
MKLVKSLLLGSAAGLTAVAGAQAADLPVRKAAPVEYVRVCSTYGAGFFFIPGTETCLRVGGRARAEFRIESDRFRTADTSGFRGLGRLNLDARTQTAYGTLRTFVRFDIARRTGVLRSGTQERLGLAFGGTGVDFTGRAQTNVLVDKAFIQFGPITAGRASSFFDFYQNDLEFLGTSGSAQPSTTLFAYTASFGGGFTATLSAEDGQERRTPVFAGGNFAGINPFTGALIAGGFDAAQRNQLPDIVAALRVDQSWGSAQLSGALHQIRVAGTTSTAFGASQLFAGYAPDTEYGFAIQGGLKFNLPMIAAGDVLWLQAAYAQGAGNYVYGSAYAFGGALANQAGDRGGVIGQTLDAVSTIYGDLKLTESYSVVAGFLHYWTPQIRQGVFGSYTKIDYSNILRTQYGPLGVIGAGGVPTAGSALGALNPNFKDLSVFAIGTNLIWSPVRDLDIGVEVLYNRLDPRGRVVDANRPFAQTVPGVGLVQRTISYDDIIVGQLRIQRDF